MVTEVGELRGVVRRRTDRGVGGPDAPGPDVRQVAARHRRHPGDDRQPLVPDPTDRRRRCGRSRPSGDSSRLGRTARGGGDCAIGTPRLPPGGGDGRPHGGRRRGARPDAETPFRRRRRTRGGLRCRQPPTRWHHSTSPQAPASRWRYGNGRPRPISGSTRSLRGSYRTTFYRIDTALGVPQVSRDSWQLKVHGMVETPLEMTYDDLMGRPMIERYITLSCVSNEVGGDLVGNALFQGVRMKDLLDEAGVQPGATQVVSRSVDGWDCGSPTSVIMDGRAMLAVAMNGESLPAEHGYPVRLVVPGLYGYVSATKWVTEIELTRWEDFDGYWVPRGWARRVRSRRWPRIDRPRRVRTHPKRRRHRHRRAGVGRASWRRQGRGLDRRRCMARVRVGGCPVRRHLAAVALSLDRSHIR